MTPRVEESARTRGLKLGAGEGSRTLDLELGKLAL